MNRSWNVRLILDDGQPEIGTELAISAPTAHQAAADYITARTQYRHNLSFPSPGADLALEVEAEIACGPERKPLKFVQRITVRGVVVHSEPSNAS